MSIYLPLNTPIEELQNLYLLFSQAGKKVKSFQYIFKALAGLKISSHCNGDILGKARLDPFSGSRQIELMEQLY
jgi:hypothetical protein